MSDESRAGDEAMHDQSVVRRAPEVATSAELPAATWRWADTPFLALHTLLDGNRDVSASPLSFDIPVLSRWDPVAFGISLVALLLMSSDSGRGYV